MPKEKKIGELYSKMGMAPKKPVVKKMKKGKMTKAMSALSDSRAMVRRMKRI